MINKESYFSLFANCIPVLGYSRSVIYDIQRNDFEFIPNSLCRILKKYNGRMVKAIYNDYDSDEHDQLNDYFSFLLDKEYIFLSKTEQQIKNFPKLDLRWDFPAIISNAIIDIGEGNITKQLYKRTLIELDELGCMNIEIRFFDKPGLLFDYCDIFEFIHTLNIYSVEIICPFYSGISNLDPYLEFYHKFERICKVSLYGVPESVIDNWNKEKSEKNGHSNIILSSQVINDASECGQISPAFFAINERMFTESLRYNSCLNRKVSVDSKGNIKNCPTLKKAYGKIGQISLKDVVYREDFRSVWNITKQQVSVCKFCEFRLMCPDCRGHNEHDLYGKPVKCRYDPITCTWN